jgi:hypothetical protein
VVSAEADLTKGENDHGAVDVEPSVDSDKPAADVKRTKLLSWRICIFPRECRPPSPFFWDAELSLRYVFWHVELVSLRE